MIDVLTPTIPGREKLLAEAVESVLHQTIPSTHWVSVDATRAGPALVRNRLLEWSSAELVAFLDDDDLLDDDHLETLLGAIQGCDLAFSWHRSEGAPSVPRFDAWCDEAWGTMLGGRNVIPITVLARRACIVDAGGFDPGARYEDYALWMRMLERGARVACVPRETWTYRMAGGNRTWQ